MTALFVPQVAVVDFHHHRGPEIELWADLAGESLYSGNDWSQLPFLALPDGAHASSEEFSYFTLVSKNADHSNPTEALASTLFGVACTRQIRSDKLKVKSADVTRSFVQKAVIVIVNKPGALGQMRERLAAITAAWFAQEDFTDTQILKEFQSSLQHEANLKRDEKDEYFGLSLRELLHELRHQTLVLFKCLLLQKRMLFFGTKCERLCMTQFALVSLIPHLLESLQDCASPELNNYEKTVNRATNLRTSERSSLLAYVGLPLQLFGLDSFFSPYTPLQQLDLLSAPTSKSYVAGSTNTLFLAQRDNPDSPTRYVDVLINLDEPPNTRVTILDPLLRPALSLTAADRRWIDNLTQTVLDTWNPADPSRPTTHGYKGSEDSVRLNFEEYILSLLSATAYKNHFDNHPNPYLSSTSGAGVSDERYPDPAETANDFNNDFLAMWRSTPNYKLWYSLTSESGIFDIVEPRHPTAGGLNIEDVQRRVGAAVAELNLDEKVRQGREQAGKAIEAGRERVGLGVARFWREVESFKERREQSRARSGVRKENLRPGEEGGGDVAGYEETTGGVVFDASRPTTAGEEGNVPNITSSVTNHIDTSTNMNQHTEAQYQPTSITTTNTNTTTTATGNTWTSWRTRASEIQLQRPNVDTAQLSAAARENASKAGAYLSSWGSWARDKSRDWQESRGNVAGQGIARGTGSGMTRVVSETGTGSSGVGGGGAGSAAAAAAAMGVGRRETQAQGQGQTTTVESTTAIGIVPAKAQTQTQIQGQPQSQSQTPTYPVVMAVQRTSSAGAIGAARSAMGAKAEGQ